MPNLAWSDAQHDIADAIDQEGIRFIVVAKGRRFGATRGMMEYMVTKASTGAYRFLWGDTIVANIHRYFDIYIHPLLQQIPRRLWRYNKTDKILLIGKSRIDFRSAENPDKWEGFDYDYIFLNEAGIILDGERGENLYHQSVLMMLTNNPKSKLIALGAPKGKNLFHRIYKEAERDKDSKAFRFSSYESPFVDRETVKRIESKMSPETAQQEIYAEFIDSSVGKFLTAFDPKKHVPVTILEPYEYGSLMLSFDFNVEPITCIVAQHGSNFLHVLDEITANHDEMGEGLGRNLHGIICRKIMDRYPGWRFVVTGDASGRKRSQHSHLNDYQAIEKELGEFHLETVAPRFNLSLYDSRALCNAVLHSFDVKIDQDCRVLIDEMGGAIWEKGQIMKDRVNRKNDHLDAFRYLVHYCLPDYLEF